VRVEWDESLVEAAVLRWINTGAARHARAFREARDRLYELPDEEARERAFAALHRRWFERFGMAGPVLAALEERGLQQHAVRVVRARAARDQLADLLTGSAEVRLLVRLTPEALVEPDRLRALLRHELMHVRDMLDPEFAYDPHLPPLDRGGPPEALVRARYHAVWDVTIDGRLDRDGLVDAGTRDRRLLEFAAAFPALGADAAHAFIRWWTERAPAHAAILRFAVEGRSLDGSADQVRSAAAT
jgi:hypothetical protein